MQQVLAALHLAEREIGFVHDDLRLDNILEEWGSDATATQHPVSKDTHQHKKHLHQYAHAAISKLRGVNTADMHARANQTVNDHDQQPDTMSDSERSVAPQHEAVQSPLPTAAAAAGQQQNGYAPAPQVLSSSSNQRGELQPTNDSTQDLELIQLHTNNRDQAHAAGGHFAASKDAYPAPRSTPNALPNFKLFDFGISVMNPDRFSLGAAASSSARGKSKAKAELKQQGYRFHKALGVVTLFHCFQWGLHADVYRMMQRLAKHLNGRCWPAADQEMVEDLLKFLAGATHRYVLYTHIHICLTITLFFST